MIIFVLFMFGAFEMRKSKKLTEMKIKDLHLEKLVREYRLIKNTFTLVKIRSELGSSR